MTVSVNNQGMKITSIRSDLARQAESCMRFQKTRGGCEKIRSLNCSLNNPKLHDVCELMYEDAMEYLRREKLAREMKRRSNY